MSKANCKAGLRLLSALLVGAGALYIHRVFRAEKRQRLTWLRSKSQVLTTEHGAIEYSVIGQGQPLLYFHGGMGGYEQGLALAGILPLDDFQVITFSRPGYRRTDIAKGGTLPEQAEVACKLLDHLGIKAATILGLSAGGMSSLQFAQNHPERCEQLILLVAQGPELAKSRPSAFWLRMMDLMMASDFFVWVLMEGGLSILTRLLQVQGSEEVIRNVKQFFVGVFPASDWRVGTTNDVEQLLNQRTIDLATIVAPTLVIHGTQDNIVPPVVARDNAAKIPNSHLIMIDDGSHLMMATHSDSIRQSIRQFVMPRQVSSS
ncbi:MAG: alpha/beta hydrolase, partial [Anaerolineales bacterium]|nr:alpha/beta hydrolase [Anaerolineales bacterium]